MNKFPQRLTQPDKCRDLFLFFYLKKKTTIHWLFENNNPGLKGKNLINGYCTDWIVEINRLLR